jgi:hypothetical protein
MYLSLKPGEEMLSHSHESGWYYVKECSSADTASQYGVNGVSWRPYWAPAQSSQTENYVLLGYVA